MSISFSNFYEKNYRELFIRIIIRCLPIIWTFSLLYFVSIYYDETFLTNYEINVRIIGVGISLISIPFFNMFLFRHFNSKTLKQHHYYVNTIFLISVILLLCNYNYSSSVFCVMNAYLLRIMIIQKSTGNGKDMSLYQSFLFYSALVMGYPLLIIEINKWILILYSMVLLFIYWLQHKKYSIQAVASTSVEKHPRIQKIHVLNSFSGLTLNNIDIFIANIIKESNNSFALALLLARRIASILELISQTFVQSFTIENIKSYKRPFKIILGYTSIAIILLHPLAIRMFYNYSIDLIIVLFLLLFAFKTYLSIEERIIIESQQFGNYAITIFLISIIGIITLLITNETIPLTSFYFISLILIGLFRISFYKLLSWK